MNNPRHGSGPHGFIIPKFDKPISSFFREFNGDVPIGKLGFKLHDKFINNAFNNLNRQMSKGHNGVKAIAEFRRK